MTWTKWDFHTLACTFLCSVVCAWPPPTTFFQPDNTLQITADLRLPYVHLSDPIWMGLPEELCGAGGWEVVGGRVVCNVRLEGQMQDLPLAWHAGVPPIVGMWVPQQSRWLLQLDRGPLEVHQFNTHTLTHTQRNTQYICSIANRACNSESV